MQNTEEICLAAQKNIETEKLQDRERERSESAETELEERLSWRDRVKREKALCCGVRN